MLHVPTAVSKVLLDVDAMEFVNANSDTPEITVIVKKQLVLMVLWTAKVVVSATKVTLVRNVDAKSAPSHALLPEHLAVTATTHVNAKLASMAIFVKRKNVQMHA